MLGMGLSGIQILICPSGLSSKAAGEELHGQLIPSHLYFWFIEIYEGPILHSVFWIFLLGTINPLRYLCSHQHTFLISSGRISKIYQSPAGKVSWRCFRPSFPP